MVGHDDDDDDEAIIVTIISFSTSVAADFKLMLRT